MKPRETTDHRFDVTDPIREHDGSWWFEVQGQATKRHGPFRNDEAALRAREALFKAYVDRANDLGGFAIRTTAGTWCITLPSEVEGGGKPWAPEVITSHRGHVRR